MFLVKPYFSQTRVSNPKQSLGAVHDFFLPTLKNNDFKNNNGIFVLEKSFLSVSISWVFGLSVLDWFKS